jgi:hypothetical protein
LNPIGPEAPSVYWVRRAALVLVVLTLVIALFWLARSVFGSDSGAETTAVDTTTTTTETTSEVVVVEEEVVASEPVDCLDSAILVKATTDAGAYIVGSKPVLTLTIENRGNVACLRDVGPKANELEVESGGYHVWSSDDCSNNKKVRVVTLKPGDKVQSTITWNGRLSQKGCPDIKKIARPGRYVVIGRNLDVRSESTPFAITNKD